jgi:hypothetical protein
VVLFLSRAGTEMQHVLYRGGAPATQALLTGDVAAHFGNPADVVPHQGGGSIRYLAIADLDRVPSLRDVPTFDETGFPGFRAETWNGRVLLQSAATQPIAWAPSKPTLPFDGNRFASPARGWTELGAAPARAAQARVFPILRSAFGLM